MSARRTLVAISGGAAMVPALSFGLVLVAILAPTGGGGTAQAITSAGDIPPEYLRLYQAAAAKYDLGADGWSYLAGVGKVECDHGRSTAVGCHRGEANSAGARGPAQFLLPTWSAYGVDADGDGRRDIYSPADAVFGMANYLEASGAPGDWRRALFAYNHSEAYVAEVLEWAHRYESQATSATDTTIVGPSAGGAWLAPLPSAPYIKCDARIVGDVEAIVRAYGVRISACQGGYPHKVNGEHPLGLATDIVPADGNWGRTMRLATDFGWSPDCASTGCLGRGPFRAVLYNGFPDHGDPAHSSIPHLHLSWEHAPAEPFTRAAWVKTLLPAPMSLARPCRGGRHHNRRRSGAGRRCHG